jgi:hypothetical protein
MVLPLIQGLGRKDRCRRHRLKAPLLIICASVPIHAHQCHATTTFSSTSVGIKLGQCLVEFQLM